MSLISAGSISLDSAFKKSLSCLQKHYNRKNMIGKSCWQLFESLQFELDRFEKFDLPAAGRVESHV